MVMCIKSYYLLRSWEYEVVRDQTQGEIEYRGVREHPGDVWVTNGAGEYKVFREGKIKDAEGMNDG